jgi:hypothetical protein
MKTGFNTLPHEVMGNIIRSGREIKFSLVDEIVAYSTSLDCVFRSNRMIKLSEIIKIPIEIGDTVLGGKFKNKRIVVKSIGKNDKGDITINNKPLLKFRLLTKDEGTCGYGVDGILGDIPAGPHLIKKKKKKKFIQTDKGKIPLENKWSQKYKKSIDCNNPKGFSQRAHCQGKKKNEGKVTNLELLKLYRKALNQIPNSPNQKKTREKIKQLRKKLNMKEALGPSDDKRRVMMLKLYGSNLVTNYKRLLAGIENEKQGVIKKSWKDFKAMYNSIEKKMEEII